MTLLFYFLFIFIKTVLPVFSFSFFMLPVFGFV